jgi:hypothetical protein
MTRKEPPWKPSHREEVIAALWYIAAFSALNARAPKLVFIMFFVLAGLSTLSFITMAINDVLKDE